MRRPSTRMSSASGSAFVPSSRAGVPLTVTRPSSISCSEARREATPACDRIFCSRSISTAYSTRRASRSDARGRWSRRQAGVIHRSFELHSRRLFAILASGMSNVIIAIDGPSGAGKGTIARAVAAELGYDHYDSGAMYRAIGWKAQRDGVPFDDEAAVARLAAGSQIEMSDTRVTLDGVDVTREIRTPAIDRAAAAVARLPRVREVLVARQRELGAAGGIVMEGRDIGTVVFPQADVKIYLDASPEERARRRANDPAHSGGPAAVADVATLLTERDRSDRTRATSPLYPAADALVVDTTGKSVGEVVNEVMAAIRGRLDARSAALQPPATRSSH